MATRITPAIVTVYIKHESQSPLANQKTDATFELLRAKGLKQKQISLVDVNPYPRLADWLEQQHAKFPSSCKHEPYPIIFIGDSLIGTYENLTIANESGQLGQKLKEHLAFVETLEKQNEEKKRTTSWLELFWGSDATEQSPTEETPGDDEERMDFEEITKPEETDENDVTEEMEIEVWRTNWLWRQQKRVLRFSTDSFMRVDPTSRAVRAVFKYDNVDSVIVVNDTNIIIRFTDSTEPQFIRTRDSAARESLLLSLVNRATMHSGHFVHVTDERKQKASAEAKG